MSKSISISFGKNKTASSISGPNGFAPKAKIKLPQPSKSALRQDSDDEEEVHPKHQSISAFEATGAVLSHAAAAKEEYVIKNPGNGDWRRRGRGPSTAQQGVQQNGQPAVVEKDEVSKASGLQFAEQRKESAPNGTTAANRNGDAATPAKPLTEDERAMNALLGNGPTASTTIIEVSGNTHAQFQDETEDFRADVASRPDSCTLDEYAAMPVEEFGMALLRGMGQKRRANGEIIKYGGDEQTNGNTPTKPREPRQGYLGIGAKAAPGADTELGAWGKTEMRKNDRGEGFYTPVMLKDKRTGELITEDELERRRKESRGGASSSRPSSSKGEADWRERRDRNLERSGRDRIRNGGDKDVKMITNGDSDDYKEQMSGFSSRHSSAGQDRDRDRDGHGSDRSKKDRSRKKDRSLDRDRDRRRYDDDSDGDDNDTKEISDGRDRERRRDRHRDRNDEKRYDSSSSRQGGGHRDRDKDSRR